MAIDRGDSSSLDFDVIAYRGGMVASDAGWRADVKKRGGIITSVPGGFFHDIPAGRFGSARPYVYELPPVWLLVLDGIDVGTAEFLDWADYQGLAENADNQMQDIRDVVTKTGGTVRDVVTGLPASLKWAAFGLAALAALEAVRTFGPRRTNWRRQ